MKHASRGQHDVPGQSGPSTGRLSAELTSYILNSFVAQLKKAYKFSNGTCSDPYLAPSSVAELLALRLVSKSWEPLVIPLYLASTEINDSIQAQTVIDILKRNRVNSASWPIKRITFGHLVYRSFNFSKIENPLELDDGEQSSELSESSASSKPSEKASTSELDDGEKTSKSSEPPAVSNDQAAELIGLLGEKVVELDLRLYGLFGLSSALVKSVGRLKDLKILKIDHRFTPPDNKLVRTPLDMYKYYSTRLKVLEQARKELPENDLEPSDKREARELAALLDATPGLERLTIGYDELQPMKFAPTTLSNLHYFSFKYSESDVEAITCICEQAKDTLKVIEYFTASEDCAELGPALEVIRNTIEGIFVVSAVAQIPRDISKTEFPRLRVLRTDDGTNVFCEGAFPDWPILRTIRTLVISFDCQEECSYFRESDLPNLEQLIFHARSPDATLNESLVQKFESRGVECHLITEIDADKIMELDLKLNGPMD